MGIWGVQPAVENPMMRGEIPKGTLLKDTYNHWVAKEIYPDKSAVPFSHHDLLIVRSSSEARQETRIVQPPLHCNQSLIFTILSILYSY